ncbi:cilia- and flagella-associated protein 300 [Patella vulgata]|uniref:cilia- and flagella-associated protein 300 n=1 Tax=Patella vulgata TaxID=6465 RepID=UPI002180691F|nr:cilia- and flagella-associated protein 300 [Patella vulgata]
MESAASKFTFLPLKDKKFPSIDGKENQDNLLKWSMKGRMKAQMFCFDQVFQPYEKDQFVRDFFKDENVINNLYILTDSGRWTSVGIPLNPVSVEIVPCSVLAMTLFDRLYSNNIVREGGAICKCLDEFYDDFTISDELRKMLLSEDSDNYDIYSDADRDEFLFRLFKHMCLGGQVCQFEDNIQPYLDITKQIYKDLISVQKNSESKELNIISSVYKITAGTDSGLVYPSDTEHEQTFSYFIVDPLKRHITVFYHRFGASAFDS